ncbi:MAG TPA: hypothetical protein VI895_03710 [Bdellovibrionota bacterium]|nr:hypothetical protein [Bdellovibrionota bacterium]
MNGVERQAPFNFRKFRETLDRRVDLNGKIIYGFEQVAPHLTDPNPGPALRL